MPHDPEDHGRQTAEALVSALEQLKHEHVSRAGGSLESQLAAGQAAVEAMKHLLGGLADDMRALDEPPPDRRI